MCLPFQAGLGLHSSDLVTELVRGNADACKAIAVEHLVRAIQRLADPSARRRTRRLRFLRAVVVLPDGALVKRNQMIVVRGICERPAALGALVNLHTADGVARLVALADADLMLKHTPVAAATTAPPSVASSHGSSTDEEEQDDISYARTKLRERQRASNTAARQVNSSREEQATKGRVTKAEYILNVRHHGMQLVLCTIQRHRPTFDSCVRLCLHQLLHLLAVCSPNKLVYRGGVAVREDEEAAQLCAAAVSLQGLGAALRATHHAAMKVAILRFMQQVQRLLLLLLLCMCGCCWYTLLCDHAGVIHCEQVFGTHQLAMARSSSVGTPSPVQCLLLDAIFQVQYCAMEPALTLQGTTPHACTHCVCVSCGTLVLVQVRLYSKAIGCGDIATGGIMGLPRGWQGQHASSDATQEAADALLGPAFGFPPPARSDLEVQPDPVESAVR